MIATVSIREALTDPELLGNALPGDTWRTWRIMLIALMGEPLEPDELETFQRLTGRVSSPERMVREAALVIGRRGGKSRSLATLACYLGCLCEHPAITLGETGVVLLIAMDKPQATILLKYAAGVLSGSPLLAGMVTSKPDDAVVLSNGVEIVARSPSFRRLRGRTAVAVVGDESAFWLSEDRSSNPDSEIINAVKPMLLTTGGPLVLASSAYRKTGVLYQAWRRDYGPGGDARTLVALGTSMDFNPSLPQEEIDRELEKDYEAASAEYLSKWRSDLENFVSLEIVERCVDDGIVERAFQARFTYRAFVDVAGGSGSDSYTVAIGHKEGERVLIDAIRETRPPFSPKDITKEFAGLLAKYRIRQVVGDQYGGDWPGEEWRDNGIRYKVSDRNKSQIYADFLPMLNTGDVCLLDHARSTSQIANLERRQRWGGKSSIDHPLHSHDDVANAVAGVATLIKASRLLAGEEGGRRDPRVVTMQNSKPAERGNGRLARSGISKHDLEESIRNTQAAEVHAVGNFGHFIRLEHVANDGRQQWRLLDRFGSPLGLVYGKAEAIASVERIIELKHTNGPEALQETDYNGEESDSESSGA